MGDHFTAACTLCDVLGPEIKRSPGGIGGTDALGCFLITHLYHGSPREGTGIMLIPEHNVAEWRERHMAPCPDDTDGDGNCGMCAHTDTPGWHPRERT